MVMPMLVEYRSVTLECGHVESFFQWIGKDATEVMCHHCHHLRAVVPSEAREPQVSAW